MGAKADAAVADAAGSALGDAGAEGNVDQSTLTNLKLAIGKLKKSADNLNSSEDDLNKEAENSSNNEIVPVATTGSTEVTTDTSENTEPAGSTPAPQVQAE